MAPRRSAADQTSRSLLALLFFVFAVRICRLRISGFVPKQERTNSEGMMRMPDAACGQW
jgi:hypothetical protein